MDNLKRWIIGIAFFGFNFNFGYADYLTPTEPITDLSTAGFYIGIALLFFLYSVDAMRCMKCLYWINPFFWISFFFLWWFFWEIYACVFGTSINEKYISRSLFYINFGCAILAAFVPYVSEKIKKFKNKNQIDLNL